MEEKEIELITEKIVEINNYYQNEIKYIMIEPFIHYESFGDTLNEVYVFTKKYLFEETKDGYLLCGTKNIYRGHYPNSSYHSHGSNGFSLYNEFNINGEFFKILFGEFDFKSYGENSYTPCVGIKYTYLYY